jgi:rhomboid protease GluP
MSPLPHEDELHKGLASLKRGRAAEAVPLLEAAAASGDARAWSALGAAYWQSGERRKGLDAFARAADLAPADPSARYNYAVALAEEGRASEAAEELRVTLRLQPSHLGASQLLDRVQNEAFESTPAHRNSRPVSTFTPAPPLPDPVRRGPYPAGETRRPYYRSLPDLDQYSWVTAALILVNVLVYWLMEKAGGSTDREVMIAYGAQFSPLVMKGQLWRLVTAIFIHAGGWHIGGNMFCFALAGRWLEPFYGRVRFFLLYLAAGLAGNLMTLLMTIVPTAGASGAVLGVLAALIVVGFKHGSVLPGHHQWKFGWLPLVFSGWVLYGGFHNTQTNNIAHVAGFCTGLILAALLAPAHEADDRASASTVRAFAWAGAGLCLYTVLGMAWSVHNGVDESPEIARAREAFAKGRLTVRLVRYRDPELKYEMRVPKGWDRLDQARDGALDHDWISPMLDAKVSILSLPVPKGQGGDLAFTLEQSLVSTGANAGVMRTLSRQKRILSGRIGGRIVKEGTDDKGAARRVFYYFVPIKDTLYILVCWVSRNQVPKYAPVFDTIAASFKAA